MRNRESWRDRGKERKIRRERYGQREMKQGVRERKGRHFRFEINIIFISSAEKLPAVLKESA